MLTKNPKIVSKKIRDFAKGKPCTLRIPGVCKGRQYTTVACHVNSNYKGVANKSPDMFTVIGCAHCHRFIDEDFWKHDYTKEQRDAELLRALMESQMEYVKAGLIEIK